MTIEKYFCSNESVENIRKYCSSTCQTDMFSIVINNETISVPIEVAIAFSSTITNSIANEPTLRKMHYEIQFRDENSINIIKNIINGNNISEDALQNNATFYDICDFCMHLGNMFIIQSYIDKKQLNDDINSLSHSEILQQLDMKQKLSNTVFSQYNKSSICFKNEIKFIAENFMDFIKDEDFIKWSKQIDKIPLLEQIIGSDDLRLDKEDSLLSFLLQLFETNNIFAILFQYLYIEYCSESWVNELINGINISRLFESQSQFSIVQCLTRGCCKLHQACSTSDIIPLESKRYKMKQIAIPYVEGQPLKGIFNYSHEKNNLLLSASSNNNPGNSI